MKIILLMNFIILLLLPAHQHMLFEVSVEFTDVLEKLTEQVLKTFFLPHHKCVVLITNEMFPKRFAYHHPEILVYNFNAVPNVPESGTNGYSLRRKSGNISFSDLLLNSMNDGCLGYIIQTDTPDSFIKLFAVIMKNCANRAQRRWFFIPTSEKKLPSNVLELMFQMDEMNLMTEILVAQVVEKSCNLRQKKANIVSIINCSFDKYTNIVDTNERTHINNILIQLLTHSFVGENPGKVIILDTWNYEDGFLIGSHLYPDKVKNIQGKVLTLATIEYSPYTVLNTSRPQQASGAEFMFIREFTRIHNASWTLLVDEENWWGEVWPNGSGNGICGAVADKKADLGFGGHYILYEVYKFVDFSMPYFVSSASCLAPKPKIVPGYLTPYLPFHRDMWIAVGTSLVIAVIALLAVTAVAQDKTTQGLFPVDTFSLWILGMLVQQSPPSTKNHPPVVHWLVLCFMVVFFIIGSSYSGGLAAILAIPRFQNPIDTVRDLADSGLTWAGNHITWIAPIQDVSDPDLKRILPKFVVLSDEKMVAMVGKAAFVTDHIQAGYFKLSPQLETVVSLLRPMKDELYWQYMAVLTPKGSPYLPSLNRLIHRLLDVGVFQHLIEEAVRKHMTLEPQLILRTSSSSTIQEPAELCFEHVEGAFYILSLGLLAASVSFWLELISKRKLNTACVPTHSTDINPDSLGFTF